MQRLRAHWIHCTIVAAFCLFVVAPVTGQGPTRDPSIRGDIRKPPPTEAEVDRAKSLLDELYGRRLKDSPAGEQIAAATSMMDRSLRLSGDDAGRFILFRTARELSIASGDVAGAFRASRATCIYFEIDPFEDNVYVFEGLARAAATQQRRASLVSPAVEFLDVAIAYEKPEIAQRILSLLDPIVASIGDAQQVKVYQDKARVTREFLIRAEEKQLLLAAAAADPENAEKNHAAGAWFARRGNWKSALPYLTRSADPRIRAAADMDADAASGLATPIAAADRWWDIYLQSATDLKWAAAGRSAHWYSAALPRVMGLHRAVIEKRIAEARNVAPPSTISSTTIPQFLGIAPPTPRVIFVCDFSGSMLDRVGQLREEVETELHRLAPGSRFNLILFSDVDTPTISKSGLLAATDENRIRAIELLYQSAASGTTNPLPALQLAISQNPDVLYIYTDGFQDIQSPETMAERFQSLNPKGRIAIHCVLLRDYPGTDDVRHLTEVLGWTLRTIPRSR